MEEEKKDKGFVIMTGVSSTNPAPHGSKKR